MLELEKGRVRAGSLYARPRLPAGSGGVRREVFVGREVADGLVARENAVLFVYGFGTLEKAVILVDGLGIPDEAVIFTDGFKIPEEAEEFVLGLPVPETANVVRALVTLERLTLDDFELTVRDLAELVV